MKNEVMIVAAEASSSHFAQRLLEYWKSHDNPVHAFGVGSQSMEELGFERLGKSEEMAVVGAAEIVEHWDKLKSVFNLLVEEATKRRPSVVIVMDYPEFNLYLARKLHKIGLKVVYYISPQVWAWRKGRVYTIKKYCDNIFLLFPFEIPFYASKGVNHEFVGHPLLDEINPKYYDPKYRSMCCKKYGFQDSDIVVGLMPGSRRIELRQHIIIQLRVAEKLSLTHKNVKVYILVAPTFTMDQVRDQIPPDIYVNYVLVKDDPFEMIQLADVILAASGTATLQVGLLHKPMVIMYKFKWLTGVFAKIMVRGIRFFGLVNLILDDEVVPERWQNGANVEDLFKLMNRYIVDPQYRDATIEKLKQIEGKLGSKGATSRVAKALEKYFK